jgi:outer membrane usher protein FimD/PapC
MRTRPCALPDRFPLLCVRRGVRLPAVLFLLACRLILSPAPSGAQDSVVLNVLLNGEPKGEIFALLAEDGDVLVKTSDLLAMGFRDPSGMRIDVAGESYLSLKSMAGVGTAFDERTLTLEITASPSLLPRRTIDLLPQRQPNVAYPKDNSAFLNFGAGYTAGNGLDFRSFDFTTEVGLRTGDYLLLSDFSYTETPDTDRFVRLMTNVTYDRREDLQRFVAGDFFASSGELGESLNLGGISLSKVYLMDPNFIRHPLAGFTGLVPLASQAEIYIDGMRVRTEKLAPGEFELKNLSYYGGETNVTVVIKDPFGKEQRVQYNYYFTDLLLKEGLHEYSYNLGAKRRDFGARSNRYAGLAFSAIHRYGIGDSLTAGFTAEGAGSGANIGPQASLRLGGAGVVTGAVSVSRDREGDAGLAGLLRHQYQSGGFNTSLSLKAYTRDYATAADNTSVEKPRYEGSLGVSYGTRTLGTLTLEGYEAKKYLGQNRAVRTAAYTRSLIRSVSLYLSLKRIKEQGSSTEAFAGLTWYPWMDTTFSASYRKAGDAHTETLQAQKSAPMGEGWGYRASLERTDPSGGSSVTAVNPYLQYNAPFGIYTGEYRGEHLSGGGRNDTCRLTASGAVVAVGGAVGLSRPVSDSFALATVGGLKGVRVSQNNQEVGRTDADGKVFLPDLGSYYENQVSINDKDIPIDYTLREVVKYISPPLRSGSVVAFGVKKLQAVTGRLRVRQDAAETPAEYVDVVVRKDGKEIVFPTGKGGEFYFEDADPGTYEGSFPVGDKSCVFPLVVPPSEEMILDLGVLVCENIR